MLKNRYGLIRITHSTLSIHHNLMKTSIINHPLINIQTQLIWPFLPPHLGAAQKVRGHRSSRQRLNAHSRLEPHVWLAFLCHLCDFKGFDIPQAAVWVRLSWSMSFCSTVCVCVCVYTCVKAECWTLAQSPSHDLRVVTCGVTTQPPNTLPLLCHVLDIIPVKWKLR